MSAPAKVTIDIWSDVMCPWCIIGYSQLQKGLAQLHGEIEAEVRWLMDREWARTAEDVVWRRTRLGLRLTPGQIAALDAWMKAA